MMSLAYTELKDLELYAKEALEEDVKLTHLCEKMHDYDAIVSKYEDDKLKNLFEHIGKSWFLISLAKNLACYYSGVTLSKDFFVLYEDMLIELGEKGHLEAISALMRLYSVSYYCGKEKKYVETKIDKEKYQYWSNKLKENEWTPEMQIQENFKRSQKLSNEQNLEVAD